MKKVPIEYWLWLARMSRKAMAPKEFKILRGSMHPNSEQECARRRQFFQRHGTAIGGGPIWEQDPRNPAVANG
jgi:hypothetical protein